MADKVHGAIVRERGRAVRDIGQRLADRVPRVAGRHACTARLTLDDGSLVVTGNYLKVTDSAGPCARNRVGASVRVDVTSSTARLLGG